jgi:hypothetical protein
MQKRPSSRLLKKDSECFDRLGTSVKYSIISSSASYALRLSKGEPRCFHQPAIILILCLCVLLAGCAVSPQVTKTLRSSIEQELLVRSLDRALATLDIRQFTGKTVTVDFYGLTPDKDFAKEYFIAWLQGHHVRAATDPKEAQLHLKVFASVLGVDQGQSFIGSPSFTVPLIGVVVPEVALFKDVRHSGHAEVEVYTIDTRSGEFVDKSPPAIGEARYDDYTILILINFTRSDVNEKWDWNPGLS